MLSADDGFGGATTRLVEFSTATVRSYPSDLSGQFALLVPELLYEVNETQFYTLDLEQTALPLPLAAGPTAPRPRADFHLIPGPR